MFLLLVLLHTGPHSTQGIFSLRSCYHLPCSAELSGFEVTLWRLIAVRQLHSLYLCIFRGMPAKATLCNIFFNCVSWKMLRCCFCFSRQDFHHMRWNSIPQIWQPDPLGAEPLVLPIKWGLDKSRDDPVDGCCYSNSTTSLVNEYETSFRLLNPSLVSHSSVNKYCPLIVMLFFFPKHCYFFWFLCFTRELNYFINLLLRLFTVRVRESADFYISISETIVLLLCWLK